MARRGNSQWSGLTALQKLCLIEFRSQIYYWACAEVQPYASFRFVIIACLALLSSAVALCQAPPRDFHFNNPSNQTTVPLSEQSVFEATINGKGPFKFFFDTGAGVNILNPEVIAQLGMTPAGDAEQLHGISGGKLDARPYRADELRIGDLTLTGQTFYNIPMPLPGVVGAVGYQLMSRLIVKADNDHRQLTIYDPAGFVYNGGGEKLELQPNGEELIVHARVGKTVGDFVLDTGAMGNYGVRLNHWFVQQHHLLHGSFLFNLFHSSYHAVFSGGADGNAPAATIERVSDLCLGAACVPHIVGEFSDGDDKSPNAGRIGNEILRRFNLTIDWKRRVVYLEKTSQWKERNIYNLTGLLTDQADNWKALVVATVYDHSAGSKAHIQVGDKIVLIDGRAPEPTWYCDDPAFVQRPGTVVVLTIQRGKSSQKINLKLRDIL